MLETIDAVPWSELKHAYGPASDVPALIRDLGSRQAEVRERALWELYGNIFHQGTRYQATPVAIPFLLELLREPATPEKAEIIGLLTCLALGYEESYLLEGVDAAAMRRQAKLADGAMSVAERAHCEEFGFGPLIDVDCYDAVRAGVPTLLTLLDSEDSDTTRAALHALAWFPEEAAVTVPVLRRFVEDDDEAMAASALISLGLLGVPPEGEDLVKEELLGHPSPLVRVAAAIAMARPPLRDGVIQTLVAAFQTPDDLRGIGDRVAFNDGDLLGYASLVLSTQGSQAREEVIPVLCSALRSAKAFESLDITEALLRLLFGEDETRMECPPPSSLDALTRSGLRAIADHGVWTAGKGEFVNYSQLLRSYGLPGSRQALRDYLEGPG